MISKEELRLKIRQIISNSKAADRMSKNQFIELEDNLLIGIIEQLEYNPIPLNTPWNLNLNFPKTEKHCVFDELMKDPNNWGKTFGLVCHCPKCTPRC